ncbi:MAG TPA: hypothetical protein EYP05_00710 [Piscirickettsiaceae bacterium]|nr:hypothetical protein [Piscirickettsiaceae bacterium]
MCEVLILAAGSIKYKFNFIKFAFNSPALLPINTRSVASFIIDFYLKHNIKVNLVINEQDTDEITNELLYYLDKINLITVNNTQSVIETLFFALNKVQNNDIIVNLVSTIPTELVDKNSYIVSNEIFKSKEYSLVFNNNFFYKGEKINEGYAFTGIFRTHKNKIIESIQKIGFKNDLMYIIENLKSELKQQKTNWIDVGHEINYNKAKNLLISSRSFNKIKIIETKGILIKSSKNKDKFIDEIKYVQMLPNDIQIYFPRILEHIKNNVKMEYYGYPTLAEYMLYWKLDSIYWEKIFLSLEQILNEFCKYSYSIGYKAYFDFYYLKYKKRINEFKKQVNYSFLFDDYIYINNNKYNNLSNLDKKIKEKILQLYSENDFCIMHGDFCFNNILFDIYSNIIRLIDARGSFGNKCKGIYGDRKYDIAKLTHSVVGQYDYIVNNIFKLNINDNKIEYIIPKRDNYEELKKLNAVLIEKLGYNYRDIMFIVGLLFVSMTPLHYDDINRQIVMYCHGIKILNESLED